VTAAELAQHLHVHPSWVYERADELEPVRLPSGSEHTSSRGGRRLRFDLGATIERLANASVSRVTVTPTFRMSPELRAQIDAVSRSRRWSFGDAMRVAAEQLVETEELRSTQPVGREPRSAA